MAGHTTGSKIHKYSGLGRVITTTPFERYDLTYTDTWDMTSHSHARGRDGKFHTGGPWSLVKTENFVSPGYLNTSKIRGPVVGIYAPLSAYSPSTRTDSSMKGLGTTAIARVEPTNPSADLATFLGELRSDGLPHGLGTGLYKEITAFARKNKGFRDDRWKINGGYFKPASQVGDEYLNVEFGWLPMVNDLRKLARAVHDRDKIIAGYVQGSDKKIRRRYAFPPTTNQKSFASVGMTYVPTGYQTISGSGSASSTVKSEDWFSGAFRYHVPVGDTYASKAARYKSLADKLLGTRITPEVVWNVAPWSWAADWFGNTGDILHNISALGHDGLVMQYGYMMSSSVTTEEHYARVNGTNSYSSLRRVKSSKKRIPASPYGFNLAFDGLTSRQKAVVVALGLSKSR